jgi:hypothetical protein
VGREVDTDASFRFFRSLQALEDTDWTGSHTKLSAAAATRLFPSDSLQDRFVRAVAAERLLPAKEIVECGEFFQRVRKVVRAPCVADLCCGHGLVGILFALFERDVTRVLLVDTRQPDTHARLAACAANIAPWVMPKLEFRVASLRAAGEALPAGVAIVSAHACGVLTDQCLDLAIRHGGPVAVMPCCYPRRTCRAPHAVQTALGHELAYDVDRTYRLEAAGYRVRWSAIPRIVTPMNRVLVAGRAKQTRGLPTREPSRGVEREFSGGAQRPQDFVSFRGPLLRFFPASNMR